MKINKKFDLLLVIFLVVLGCFLTVLFNLKPLTGGFVSLLPPALYLIFRKKKNLKKIFWAVAIFGILFGFIFDFIVTLNEGWIVTRLVFPFRLFGFYPLFDDILGFMLMTLIIVVFYEHFLDDENNKRISKNLIRALVIPSIALTIMLIIYFIDPDWLQIPYVYLIAGIAAIIFPLSIAWSKPRFLEKFLAVVAFFFGVWFLAELAALKTGSWIFPGQYIGRVEVFGLVFPFEELFFWMLFYAATVVAYYEHYVDDAR